MIQTTAKNHPKAEGSIDDLEGNCRNILITLRPPFERETNNEEELKSP